MTNLMDGVLDEMNRVRELVKIYDATPNGTIAAALMRQSISQAERTSGNAVAGKDGEPFRSFSFKNDLLERAFDVLRKLRLQIADHRNSQSTPDDAETFFVVNDRVEGPCRLEARESGFQSGLNPLKECTKRLVELPQSLSHRSSIHTHVLSVGFTNRRDLVDLIETRNSNAVYVPSIAPLLEGSVIKITDKIQRIVQLFELFFVGIKPDFIRSSKHQISFNYSI